MQKSNLAFSIGVCYSYPGDYMRQTIRGSALLLLTTVIWGSTFVAQSLGMDHVGPFTFQAIRCAMAALVLLPVIACFDRGKQDGKTFFTRFLDKKLWLGGILCGAALCLASNLQQLGLVSTDAGKSAFLTAMYIVFVPILGVFTGRKPALSSIISVVIAVFGLYFLSCAGVSDIQIGDIVLVLCALAFSVQILLVDRYAPQVDGLRLNCIQALVTAIGSAILMLLFEQPTLTGITGSWWSMCYAGILSMGAAYSLQILGQKEVEPTLASLIMSLESVVALLCGWLFLHETMRLYEILGCVLMFIAILLSQFPIPRKST